MQHLIPPLCLLLALALLVAGFALWWVEPPEAGMALHEARVRGDERYTEALEAQLRRRQWSRRTLLVGLFCGSGAMVAAAFLLMQPAKTA